MKGCVSDIYPFCQIVNEGDVGNVKIGIFLNS